MLWEQKQHKILTTGKNCQKKWKWVTGLKEAKEKDMDEMIILYKCTSWVHEKFR